MKKSDNKFIVIFIIFSIYSIILAALSFPKTTSIKYTNTNYKIYVEEKLITVSITSRDF